MKASELRIGNLVENRSSEIIKIDEYQIQFFELWHQKKYSENPPFKPISITEDWLLRFGFTVYSNDYLTFPANDRFDAEKINGQWVIQICYGQFADSGSPLFDIKYIHQLQNLYYALTGEELTIN